MSHELVRYERARQALIEAKSVDEIKSIRNKAVALQAYAKQALDNDLISYATEIRIRAERRAGEMLREMRQSGERAKSSGDAKPEFGKQTLSQLGVTKAQSHQWQRLSDLAQEDFEKRVEEAKRTGAWTVDWLPGDRAAEKKERHAPTEIRGLPAKQYGLIYASPFGRFRAPAKQLAQIKARDVQSIAADDCVLALWAQPQVMEQACEVLNSWGFEYQTNCAWLKSAPEPPAPDAWFSEVTEFLLIGTRGHVPSPLPEVMWEGAFDAEASEPGAKPVAFQQLLESYFPNLPKIELNARGPRPGWDIWGAEAPLSLDGIAE